MFPLVIKLLTTLVPLFEIVSYYGKNNVFIFYAVHWNFRAAYKQGKKERPPFIKSTSPVRTFEERTVPRDLTCSLCGDLLKDAVVIPCCGNSYCDECKHECVMVLIISMRFQQNSPYRLTYRWPCDLSRSRVAKSLVMLWHNIKRLNILF